jgi:hypothetical protein
MFITNLLGSSYNNFPAAQNPEAEAPAGFMEIMENSLSENQSDGTQYSEGDLIDLNLLNTPDFYFKSFPFTNEGFQVSPIESTSWQLGLKPA